MRLAQRFSHRPPEQFGVLARLFVSPGLRRAGLARTLVRTAEARAVGRGLWPMHDVGTHFQSAIRLCESCGWTRAGRVTVPLPNESLLDEFVYLAPSPVGSV
jgi:GNAT superfamily N-acetyltransferase